MKTSTQSRTDVYSRVTSKIIADLEKGVRPWQRPWNVENVAGRISRPLRHNGTPYRGVNVLLLWCEAQEKGYSASVWMTFKQAQQLGATVRKGEHGSLVVFADRFTKTETDPQGQESAREIPFMKGFTVFNVEQIDGLPASYTPSRPRNQANPWPASRRPRGSSPPLAQPFDTAAAKPSMPLPATWCKCRHARASRTRKAIAPPWPMNLTTHHF